MNEIYYNDEIRILKELILPSLTSREYYVVTQKHGIDCDERTFVSISEDLNVTPMTVGNIYKIALSKLQNQFTKMKI